MKKVLKQSIIALLVAGAAGAAGAASNSNETADPPKEPIEAKHIYPVVYDNGQILRGFQKGDKIITDVDNDGRVTAREATEEDVESDPFKGVGLVQAVVDLKGGIIQVADDLGKTIKAVNENTQLLDQHSEAITEIGDLVEDNSKAIADLEKTSAAHSENLDKLNKGIEAVENNLNDTVKTVQKNTEAVTKNTEAVTKNAEAVTKNTEAVTKNAEAVTKNTEAVTKNAEAVTKNTEAVTKNAEAVSKNAEAVSKNAELLSKHTDAITKTADLANENSQAIADLKRIANQDLSNIQNKADKSELIALSKELKRGLAAQAALNGLFQPYSIGKANVTAAFGGYKKYTAVAIGTGYRFNENFAAKAGVAFTKGSTTYNAGVNFEW
ncbi:Adhesin YadA precursor [Haemophilus influenzae]|nr:Adhesin YadA precursor [Haemophilus influenzae]